MTTETTKHQRPGWGAVALWIIATIIGWTTGWSPLLGQSNMMLSAWSTTSGMYDFTWIYIWCISGAMIGAINGLILGFGQWIILRKWLHLPRRDLSWLLVTILGMCVGSTLGETPVLPALSKLRQANGWDYDVQFAPTVVIAITIEVATLTMVMVGLAVGIFQWLALRRWISQAWWWIIASVVAWPTGSTVYWLVYGSLNGPFCQSFGCAWEESAASPGFYLIVTTSWVAGGIVIGGITGIALRTLLAQPSMINPGVSTSESASKI